jgi:cytochrome c oxidase subunit 1
MPSPSYWPLVMAVGITLLVLGIVYSFWLSGIGLIIFLTSLVGWLREPTGV